MDKTELSKHVINHVITESHGLFQCKWKSCTRGNRSFNAKYDIVIITFPRKNCTRYNKFESNSLRSVGRDSVNIFVSVISIKRGGQFIYYPLRKMSMVQIIWEYFTFFCSFLLQKLKKKLKNVILPKNIVLCLHF